MARTVGASARAGPHSAARPAAGPIATGPPEPAARRSSLADRHPAHWATTPLPTQAALTRHSELLGRTWVPSLALLDWQDGGVPDPNGEWRVDVCLRGNAAKGCPHLVVTALVTAVGEYLTPDERPPQEDEKHSVAETAAGSAQAPSSVQAAWARRASGWQARPRKRGCVGR